MQCESKKYRICTTFWQDFVKVAQMSVIFYRDNYFISSSAVASTKFNAVENLEIRNRDHLKERLVAVWTDFEQAIVGKAIDQWRK